MDTACEQGARHRANAPGHGAIRQAGLVIDKRQLVGALRIAVQQILREIEVRAGGAHRRGVWHGEAFQGLGAASLSRSKFKTLVLAWTALRRW